MGEDVPSHARDRMRGHARPSEHLIFSRPPKSRHVFVGIVELGYVRLKLREAREFATGLLMAAGVTPDNGHGQVEVDIDEEHEWPGS